jgi:hypothetical protein
MWCTKEHSVFVQTSWVNNRVAAIPLCSPDTWASLSTFTIAHLLLGLKSMSVRHEAAVDQRVAGPKALAR